MPWVKLDDGFADHPKVERAGPLAAWLHITAICYCARHLTDGLIPKAKALRLAAVPQPARRIADLLAVGLWDEEGDFYRVHDYLEYQPARAQVEAEREAARGRMTKARASRSSPEQAPNVRESFADRSPNPDPTRPLPDVDQGQGQHIRASTNGQALALVDTDFAEFWHAYPAKKGKPAAKAAWAKAIKRAEPSVIIAGARAYANDPDRDPEHTKYPQGWLNDDRWDDERIARPLKMSKGAHNVAAWLEATT